jgi:hypothetical protein
VIDAPLATVWNETTQWLADNKEPVQTADEKSGSISLDYGLSSAPAGLMDCGKPGKHNEVLRAHAATAITIQPVSPNQTSVAVDVSGDATMTVQDVLFGQALGTFEVVCQSTGQFESRLFDYLRHATR